MTMCENETHAELCSAIAAALAIADRLGCHAVAATLDHALEAAGCQADVQIASHAIN